MFELNFNFLFYLEEQYLNITYIFITILCTVFI